MNELKKCINKLKENHTNSEIGQALYEYSQIVSSVAEDYNDDITVEELRSEHPELDFMDDEELEEILELARGIRSEEIKMNELKIFENKEFGQIRTVTINNEPWFVGKDIAVILGYSNSSKAVSNHVDDEDKNFVMLDITDSQNGNMPIGKSKTAIINESGLYSLILSSKLPTAKKFKRWVTSEVLPAIRKHGVYAVDEVLENPDMLIAALQELKEERAKRKQLQMDNERMKPKELFADAVATSDTCILVGELAKILKQNGVENMGQNRLFAWLRENGFLIRRKGTDYNMPTQKSMEKGLFEVKESTSVNADGSIRLNKTPKVTGRGQQYFINYFLSRGDSLSDVGGGEHCGYFCENETYPFNI